jgi:hypothetical protein
MLDFIRSQNRKVRCDWKAGDDMEILRFEDQGPSAPHRKKSSRGFLVVGLIATLFGISSAFASSTITINTNNTVNLGQGVVKVSGCDTSLNVVPNTVMALDSSDANKPKFYLDKISISNLDTSTPVNGNGCEGKVIHVQVFDEQASPAAYGCGDLNSLGTVSVSYANGATSADLTSTCADDTLNFTVPIHTYYSNPNPIFSFNFNKANSGIGYITLTSSDPL